MTDVLVKSSGGGESSGSQKLPDVSFWAAAPPTKRPRRERKSRPSFHPTGHWGDRARLPLPMPEDRLCIARQKEGTDTVPSRGQVPAQQPTSAASNGRGRYAWSFFERGNNRISRFAFTQFDLAQNSQATRLTAKPPAQVRKPAALPSSHHTRRFR